MRSGGGSVGGEVEVVVNSRQLWAGTSEVSGGERLRGGFGLPGMLTSPLDIHCNNKIM